MTQTNEELQQRINDIENDLIELCDRVAKLSEKIDTHTHQIRLNTGNLRLKI